MNRDALLHHLESAFKLVLCESLTGTNKEAMDKNVEGFFREGISYYTFEELLEQFSPPQKGIKLFLDYILAREQNNNKVKH